MESVSGAAVVVTGAGSGIGAALARRLAAEGARVVVNDIDPAAAAAVAASCGAAAVPGDAASEDGVAALIGAARDALGGIDLYCANAGVARAGGEQAAEPDWELSWQVNVMGHIRAARLLLPGWLAQGSGHLICTVSAAGLLSTPGSAPYAATKHAALAFAEWLSLTHRHRGLTVQAICPMGVRTGMFPGGDGRSEKLLGPEHYGIAISLDWLAQIHFRQGRHAEAESELKRGIAIAEKATGPDSQLVIKLLDHLISVVKAEGRAQEATALTERTQQIIDKSRK